MLEVITKSSALTVPAMIFRQLGDSPQQMFMAVMKVRDLVKSDLIKIDFYRRTADSKDDGYQRLLSNQEVKAIKNFLLYETSTPRLPSAMILNCREPLKFEESILGSGSGILTINSNCFLLDGQHRYEGWKLVAKNEDDFAPFLNYEVPVIILSNFDRLQEIEQFYVINSRQKKIETDLAQRHLMQLSQSVHTKRLIPPHLKWQVHSTHVIDGLNESEGVWKGKIMLPSDDKNIRQQKTIRQSAFVRSLKPLFVGRERLFKTDVDNDKIQRIVDLLKSFWTTIKEYYPEAVHQSDKYLLMRGVGVHAMHQWLASMELDMRPTKAQERENKIRNEIQALEKSDFNLAFWEKDVSEEQKRAGKHAGAFSSTAGYLLLADYMRLKKVIPHR